MTRVLIVDDHGMLRELLRGLLEAEPGIIIVGDAEDGRKGLQMAMEHNPDVIISDLRMKGMGGLDMIREIRAFSPGARVIVFSMHGDPSYVALAMDAGASGYVLKDSGFTDLLQAIATVSEGQTYVSPSIFKP
jgi:DNA-binding NarL/FixJ family response regulator